MLAWKLLRGFIEARYEIILPHVTYREALWLASWETRFDRKQS